MRPASSHVENRTKIRFLSWAQGSCKSIYRELFLLGPIRQRRKTKLGSGGAAATRHPLLSTACSAPAPQPQPARSSRLLSEGHAWDPIPESTSPKAERRAEGSCRLVPGPAQGVVWRARSCACSEESKQTTEPPCTHRAVLPLTGGDNLGNTQCITNITV